MRVPALISWPGMIEVNSGLIDFFNFWSDQIWETANALFLTVWSRARSGFESGHFPDDLVFDWRRRQFTRDSRIRSFKFTFEQSEGKKGYQD